MVVVVVVVVVVVASHGSVPTVVVRSRSTRPQRQGLRGPGRAPSAASSSRSSSRSRSSRRVVSLLWAQARQ
jgi:hypothetical protein